MTGDLFAVSVKKAIAQDLSITGLLEAIEKLAKAGETSLVAELYQVWIKHNKAHPLLYAIYFNYGVMQSDCGNLQGAREAFNESIKANPNFWPPQINLGTLLERLGDVQGAVNQWTQLVNALQAITGDAIFHKTTALKQIGRVLETARMEVNAEDALRLGLDIDPHQSDVLQHWIALRQVQAKWPIIVPWERVNRRTQMRGISPLSLAAYTDDPMFQLANAHHYHASDVASFERMFTAGGWAVPEKPRARRLRIGYLSSDLREHAIGFLTAGIYELHDREKVEVFAYYCGIPSDDTTQRRIKATVDHWIDISGMTDPQAAKQIIDDEIDILVDVNGYTKDARTKVLAMRPAPIIVNWLGYPGTMGSPFHHYIIADDTIIPKASEIYYSEKVLRLPCYQPNDRKRVVSSRQPTRAEHGLPAGATVFCTFNGVQKITRFMFERWMAILRGVQGSVLWIMGGTADTNARLRQTAEQHGVSGTRLIFAEKRANPDHVARYTLADLYLDTSPYGAHTTASDAMWMGVPVLTVPGRSFASRVCASLVQSAGLPELVCNSPEDYVTRAIEFGRNPEKLAAYKTFLLENRHRSTLFDTEKLVRHFERLYEQMWSDYASGRLPQPDFTNIDVYHEVGCDIDHEDIELLTVPDYELFYRQHLAYRHAFAPFGADKRLWPDEMVAPSAVRLSKPPAFVMPGLEPGIQGPQTDSFPLAALDGRVKPGHDEVGIKY